MCAVFDPARDEKVRRIIPTFHAGKKLTSLRLQVRRTWVTDHDPKYLRQQRNSVFCELR